MKVGAAQANRLGALLEHYARYVAPLRLSDACTDLPGALRVRLLDCKGRLDDNGVFDGDAQRPELPEVPRGADGAYALTEADVFCIELANTSAVRLKTALVDCGSEGSVTLFGEALLRPGEARVFWLREAAGQPYGMTIPDGRAALLDRFVAIGTSAVERSFASLAVSETFADVLDTRAPGAPRGYPPPERWTSARAIARTRRAP